MNAAAAKTKPAVGFLTVVEHAQHGLFGGYLLLNLAGRPLEFHCTAPIKPNRAQQILYGPTLESFLYGEQIGSTLLTHAKIEPLVICTDREPMLSVRELVKWPVTMILPSELAVDALAAEANPASEAVTDDSAESGDGRRSLRLDAAHRRGPRLVTFELGQNRFGVAERFGDDRRLIAERLAEAAESFDLLEPFGRIREAIEEAQQAAR